MKIPDQWMSRARFTAGVLLVWAGVSLLSGIVNLFLRTNASSSRLSEHQLCTVFDFMSKDVFAPTGCYVFDHEYQINPRIDPLKHTFAAVIDLDTLVMVYHDDNAPAIKKGEPGRIDVDERLVSVYFISGTLTGRRGMIERYKLNIHGFER